MALYKTIRSESGFGLIQAVAALFIASIAIAGLFLASYISRHEAISNYHYRVALLKGAEVLDEIKFWTEYYGSTHPVTNFADIGEFTMDEQDGEIIKGFVHPITVKSYTDLTISNYTKYDRLWVRITWLDGPRYILNSELNRQKQIILQEDYYYRSDVVTP